MPFDVTRLNSWLNNSKIQVTNNPLWQLLRSVIGFIQENSDEIIKLHETIPDAEANPNTVLHGAGDPRFRQVATDDIFDLAVTYDKIQTVTGDRLLGRTGSNGVVEEIELGTNLAFAGNVLNASASSVVRALTFNFGDGVNVIAVNSKVRVYVPYGGTITAVTMWCDPSGSIVADIWMDSYANIPPTIADTITASAKPTITSGVKSQDTTLTDWTTTVPPDSALIANIDSVTDVKFLTMVLTIQ